MKHRLLAVLSFAIISGIALVGCSGSSESGSSKESVASIKENSSESGIVSDIKDVGSSANENEITETDDTSAKSSSELSVKFGYDGDTFTLHLYENDTAAAIAKHVGTSDWNLPIYHYDDYENWEVMQYYDIPSRYEIPSEPEEYTQEKAGEVYYSEPNRIIMFYHDGEVTAEYTPVGYFDYTDEFVEAVESNPVLEGWGNKIVSISDGE